MHQLTGLLVVIAFCLAPATAAPPTVSITPVGKDTVQVIEGKVVPLANALKKLGAKPDADSAGVAFVTADGIVYTLVKDDVSRLLFLDKQLHKRDVRLTGKRLPGTQILKVEKVQTVKAGKVFDVDYWCENCQLAYPQPGKCMCCGSETELRERLTK
jgi:hypothetical protein